MTVAVASAPFIEVMLGIGKAQTKRKSVRQNDVSGGSGRRAMKSSTRDFLLVCQSDGAVVELQLDANNAIKSSIGCHQFALRIPLPNSQPLTFSQMAHCNMFERLSTYVQGLNGVLLMPLYVSQFFYKTDLPIILP